MDAKTVKPPYLHHTVLRFQHYLRTDRLPYWMSQTCFCEARRWLRSQCSPVWKWNRGKLTRRPLFVLANGLGEIFITEQGGWYALSNREQVAQHLMNRYVDRGSGVPFHCKLLVIILSPLFTPSLIEKGKGKRQRKDKT